MAMKQEPAGEETKQTPGSPASDKTCSSETSDSAVSISRNSPLMKSAATPEPTEDCDSQQRLAECRVKLSSIHNRRSLSLSDSPDLVVKVEVTGDPGDNYSLFMTKSQSIQGLISSFPQLKKLFDLSKAKAVEDCEFDFSILEVPGNTFAIQIILGIAHFRFQHVPEKPFVLELYHATRLAQEHECLSIFRPWAKNWCNGILARADLSDKALTVAWDLGDLEVLRILATRMVETMEFEDGRYAIEQGEPIEGATLPNGLFGMLLSRAR